LPPSVRAYDPNRSLKAPRPGAAPGPPVESGARVRRFRGYKDEKKKLGFGLISFCFFLSKGNEWAIMPGVAHGNLAHAATQTRAGRWNSSGLGSCMGGEMPPQTKCPPKESRAVSSTYRGHGGGLQSPCGGALPQRRPPFDSTTRPNRLHTHTHIHSPKRLAHPRSPIPPLSALAASAALARPLHLTALASMPSGIVLVRVRVPPQTALKGLPVSPLLNTAKTSSALKAVGRMTMSSR